MDFRKINSYAILLAIVVVVGLLVSMIARFVILEKGADTGTANLVFIIVMGVCAIFYLTVMAAFSSVADFVVDKILPKITRKNAPAVEAKITEPANHVSDMDIEQIKQEVDKRFLERQKGQIELFRRYAHREVGPYITSDELVRLDRYIEYYALQESGSTELLQIYANDISLLSNQSSAYVKGIIITSAHMAKGLEFDEVIIPQTDDKNYHSNIDKSMLYVAATRAMHKLTLTYSVSSPSCRFL